MRTITFILALSLFTGDEAAHTTVRRFNSTRSYGSHTIDLESNGNFMETLQMGCLSQIQTWGSWIIHKDTLFLCPELWHETHFKDTVRLLGNDPSCYMLENDTLYPLSLSQETLFKSDDTLFFQVPKTKGKIRKKQKRD